MYKPIFCIAVAVGLVGCRQRENVRQLKAISKSLQYANDILKNDNRLFYEALIDKLHDPRSLPLGIIWEPRGKRIRRESDSIVVMIEGLKASLLKQTDSFRKENTAWVEQVPGNKLIVKLSAFKDSLPSIIHVDDFKETPARYESIKKEVFHLNTTLPLLPGYIDSLNDTQRKQYAKNWQEENFSGISPVMAMVVLDRLESDVLATTKTYMEYCLNKTAVLTCGWNADFYPLASLSSSYVKRGQSVEITAGIGAFSVATRPQIIINGQEIPLTDYATAVHRITASGKPGKHQVNVKVKFTKPDGVIATIEKSLEYIIADEK